MHTALLTLCTSSPQPPPPGLPKQTQGHELTAGLVADFGGGFTSELVRSFGRYTGSCTLKGGVLHML